MGPRKDVCVWNNYYINNFNFHTYSYGKDKSTMNYGVCVRGVDGVEYYGVLQEVLQLTYVGANGCYKTTLFKCDWFDSSKGTNIHKQYKLVEIDHTRKYPKYDPFVLATQVQQVYFTPYPSIRSDKSAWWAVFKVKARSTIDAPVADIAFQEDLNDNPPTLSTIDLDDEDTLIEYNELMEVDVKDVQSGQDEDESEEEVEDEEDLEE